MKVAIYGRRFNTRVVPFLQHLFDSLLKKGIDVVVYDKFHELFKIKFLCQKLPKLFRQEMI